MSLDLLLERELLPRPPAGDDTTAAALRFLHDVNDRIHNVQLRLHTEKSMPLAEYISAGKLIVEAYPQAVIALQAPAKYERVARKVLHAKELFDAKLIASVREARELFEVARSDLLNSSVQTSEAVELHQSSALLAANNYDFLLTCNSSITYVHRDSRLSHFLHASSAHSSLSDEIKRLECSYQSAGDEATFLAIAKSVERKSRTGWFRRSRLAKDCKNSYYVEGFVRLRALNSEIKDALMHPSNLVTMRSNLAAVADLGTKILQRGIEVDPNYPIALESLLKENLPYISDRTIYNQNFAKAYSQAAARVGELKAEKLKSAANWLRQYVNAVTVCIGSEVGSLDEMRKSRDRLLSFEGGRATELLRIIVSYGADEVLSAEFEDIEKKRKETMDSYGCRLAAAHSIISDTNLVKNGGALRSVDTHDIYNRDLLLHPLVIEYRVACDDRKVVSAQKRCNVEATVTKVERGNFFYLSDFVSSNLSSPPTERHYEVMRAMRGDRGSSLAERMEAFKDVLTNLPLANSVREVEYIRAAGKAIELALDNGALIKRDLAPSKVVASKFFDSLNGYLRRCEEKFATLV